MSGYPYSLVFTFDSASVSELVSAGQSVSIIRTTNSSAYSGTTSDAYVVSGDEVVWATFAPSQTATLAWDDSLFVYQSAQAGTGTAIVANSTQAVQPGYVATYTTAGFTSVAPVSDGADLNDYYVSNQSGNNALSFGLAQSYDLNGSATPAGPYALSNQAVLNAQIGEFSASDQVGVFLWSGTGSGVVVNTATIGIQYFNVGSGTPVNIAFNATTNSFYSTG